MGDLDGRVAVVTGGARGIGLGCAECLSEAGAAVVIADIDFEQAQKSAGELGERALAVHHDVRDGESARATASPRAGPSRCCAVKVRSWWPPFIPS